jgi:hypothetical protein
MTTKSTRKATPANPVCTRCGRDNARTSHPDCRNRHACNGRRAEARRASR